MNYFLILLTLVTCKTIEHILISHIKKHLELNNILPNLALDLSVYVSHSYSSQQITLLKQLVTSYNFLGISPFVGARNLLID